MSSQPFTTCAGVTPSRRVLQNRATLEAGLVCGFGITRKDLCPQAAPWLRFPSLAGVTLPDAGG
jgi:hypothetical protein